MKLNVTPELATLLKTLRVHNGITSKDAAELVGKSPSYLSKLEGCAVQTIEEDQLKRMVCFYAGSDDLYGEALPAAVKLFAGTVEPACLVRQTWLFQLDVIERPVKVPEAMAAEMAKGLADLDVSAAEFAEIMNKNIDAQTPAGYPANQASSVESAGGRRLLMRVEAIVGDVEGVLFTPGFETTYFLLYNVVLSLFRLRHFRDVDEKLPPDQAVALLRRTAGYMDRWDVHSLIGFSHFISSEEFIEYQLPLAEQSEGLFDRTLDQLREITSFESLRAIDNLTTFNETFEWDPGFALKVAGIPFAKLGDMSFANKSKLIAEIQALVDEYADMDDFERRIESY